MYGWLREELSLVGRILADPAYQSAGFLEELTERAARLRHTAAQITQSAPESLPALPTVQTVLTPAEILGVTESTVSWRMHEIRKLFAAAGEETGSRS